MKGVLHMSAAGTSTSKSKVGTWTATLSHNELKVNGEVTFPTTGYTVSLKKKEPQGINPTILLLEMTVVTPNGIVADHVVNQIVSFKEHTTVHYQEVEILPNGIKIKVSHS
jgi:hypothetical protein